MTEQSNSITNAQASAIPLWFIKRIKTTWNPVERLRFNRNSCISIKLLVLTRDYYNLVGKDAPIIVSCALTSPEDFKIKAFKINLCPLGKFNTEQRADCFRWARNTGITDTLRRICDSHTFKHSSKE